MFAIVHYPSTLVRSPSEIVAPVASTMFWIYRLYPHPKSPCFAAAQITLQLVFLNIVQKLLGGRPEMTLDTKDHGIHSDDVAPVKHRRCVNIFWFPGMKDGHPKIMLHRHVDFLGSWSSASFSVSNLSGNQATNFQDLCISVR